MATNYYWITDISADESGKYGITYIVDLRESWDGQPHIITASPMYESVDDALQKFDDAVRGNGWVAIDFRSPDGCLDIKSINGGFVRLRYTRDKLHTPSGFYYDLTDIGPDRLRPLVERLSKIMQLAKNGVGLYDFTGTLTDQMVCGYVGDAWKDYEGVYPEDRPQEKQEKQDNDNFNETVNEVLDTVRQIKQHAYDDGFAMGRLSRATYDLYMVTTKGDGRVEDHLCGHDNPFWLCVKAGNLLEVLSDMTPNISFEIRNNEGEAVVCFDGYDHKVTFHVV